MKISPAGVSLIKRFAPLNLTAHLDTNGWVVGYACRDIGRWRVTPGYKITTFDAERLLHDRVDYVTNLVNTTHMQTALTQNEFDALVCHIYFMLHPDDFRTSDIARHLIVGDKESAATAILCDIADTELERRTIAEAYLFRKGV